MNQTSLASLVVPVLPAMGTGRSMALGRRAALHHALHHRGELVGRDRVHDPAAVALDRGAPRPAGRARSRAVDAVALVVAVDRRRRSGPARGPRAWAPPARRRWRTSRRRRPCGTASSPATPARSTGTGSCRRRRRTARRSRRPSPCRSPARGGSSSGSATARCRSAAASGRSIRPRRSAAARGPAGVSISMGASTTMVAGV